MTARNVHQALLDKEADALDKGKIGKTAAQVAIARGAADAARMLIEKDPSRPRSPRRLLFCGKNDDVKRL